jgi:glycosyltransferase involved in cell wall biosynthesis
MLGRPKKVALVTGICVRHDAISASVRDDAMAFSGEHGYSTKVYTYSNDYPELDATVVGGPADILFDQHFREADLLIYHFGIYYDLFNTIMIGNGHAPQTVRYHNITSKQWLPQSDWNTIDRSRRQLYNCRAADRIWPVSEYNASDLTQHGIVAPEDIDVIPLMVGDGVRRGSLLDKDASVTRIVFLGRFVKSKGLTDLLRGIAAARRMVDRKMTLRLLGSPKFSSRAYIDELRQLIAELRLDDCVTIVGEVTEAELAAEFRQAHILAVPSYHEGFCKPVIESMSFGCVPITYDAGNLAYVAQGHSVIVPAGDIAALAGAIADVSRMIGAIGTSKGDTAISVQAGTMTLSAYDARVDEIVRDCGAPAVSVRLRAAAEALLARSTGA